MSAGHPVAEFWECSPGQIVHVLKAHGLIKKKGSAAQLLTILGRHKGVKMRGSPPS